jgi:hypothetical protein
MRSEQVAFKATYNTTAGDLTLYALPPSRRLDMPGTVEGRPTTVGMFFTGKGTYACDLASQPRVCERSSASAADGTPHAQPTDSGQWRVESAPERAIVGLRARCFKVVSRRDERLWRDVCFSPQGMLLYVGWEKDGAVQMLEATAVSAVAAEDLDPVSGR